MSLRLPVSVLLGALAAAAGVWLAGAPALTAPDLDQPRLDLAAPLPHGGEVLEQSFTPAHNGLSAVEVLAVVYPPAESSLSPSLALTLTGPAGVVAHQSFSDLAHNAPLRLTFAPQPASAGQVYTLALRGPAGGSATAWAYSVDGYVAGQLTYAGQPQPGDLRFTTTYTYLWTDVVHDLWTAAVVLLRLALPLWLLLFVPGLLLLGLRRESEPLAQRLGLALALSLAVLALAWLWAGTLGGRWSIRSLSLAYGLAGLVVAAQWLIHLRRTWSARPRPRPDWHLAGLLFIVVIGSWPRLVAIRDLVVPQWVDGSHHYAIARVLEAAGHVPPGYAPLLPIERFSYHFGWHVLAVSAHWLSGLALPDVFLWFGQVLQALVPLSAHAAVTALTRRPRAGLLAAAFVAFIAYFPGYYVTWGRYTQLAGVLLLLPALAAVTRLFVSAPVAAPLPADGPHRTAVWFVALLAAGLLLTHYPLFILWLVWVLVCVAFALGRWVSAVFALSPAAPTPSAPPEGGPARRADLHGLPPLVLAGLAGALLAAPWLWRMGGRVGASLLQDPGLFTAPAGYNAFPAEYFTASLERGWIVLAIIFLGAGLIARDGLVWRVAAWVAVTWLIVNAGQGTWLVNNNTLAITLFVPGAILLGWGGDRWLALAEHWLRPETVAASAARAGRVVRALAGALFAVSFGAAVGYGAGRGLPTQAGLINPVTVLAAASDAEALAWIDTHIPPDAVFAINAWEWLNGTWAGSDGGAWIWPLTGRRTTLPPVDYAYGSPAQQAAINDYNRRLYQVADLDPPAVRALLQEAGVTHLYMGARGGPLQPERFLAEGGYRLLFTNGAAWVFAIVP